MLLVPDKGCRKKEITMKFKTRGARLAGLLVPALALAAPAFAQVRDTRLSDATEPGSVIVFPKFINGSAYIVPESVPAPATELEIGVVCPKGVTCAEHQPVKIRFHWVCGTSWDGCMDVPLTVGMVKRISVAERFGSTASIA